VSRGFVTQTQVVTRPFKGGRRPSRSAYGVRPWPSRSCGEIDHAHLHLALGISADDPEGDLIANACVFQYCGKVCGCLSALTVGGYDDVADHARGHRIARVQLDINGVRANVACGLRSSEIRIVHVTSASRASGTVRFGPIWFTSFNM
jgi:hypothetical protein